MSDWKWKKDDRCAVKRTAGYFQTATIVDILKSEDGGKLYLLGFGDGLYKYRSEVTFLERQKGPEERKIDCLNGRHDFNEKFSFRMDTNVGSIFFWRCMKCHCVVSNVY